MVLSAIRWPTARTSRRGIGSANMRRSDAWKERLTMMQTFFVSEEMQGRIWTTTNEALSAALDAGEGINEPIWHRGKDLIGETRDEWWEHPVKKRGRFIEQCIQKLPTYSLFA